MTEVKLAKTPCKLELYLTVTSPDFFSVRFSRKVSRAPRISRNICSSGAFIFQVEV